MCNYNKHSGFKTAPAYMVSKTCWMLKLKLYKSAARMAWGNPIVPRLGYTPRHSIGDLISNLTLTFNNACDFARDIDS